MPTSNWVLTYLITTNIARKINKHNNICNGDNMVNIRVNEGLNFRLTIQSVYHKSLIFCFRQVLNLKSYTSLRQAHRGQPNGEFESELCKN
ncbi:MAG: hypothetical protein ACI9SP_000251 [Arenicella sp.]|jgi:hypothetical protein